MNVMQEMQKMAPEIVPICRKITGFMGGRNVDIVGVTGSIPVTPTIQINDLADVHIFPARFIEPDCRVLYHKCGPIWCLRHRLDPTKTRT